MHTIEDFLIEELESVNSMITPKIRHNRKLCECITSYIEVLELLAVANFIHQQEQEKPPRRERRAWVWPYLQRRLEHGHYENLMQELGRECPHLYKSFTRTTQTFYDELVERLTPYIQKKNNVLEETDPTWTASGHHPTFPCHW